jgi:hypothetical protein
LNSNTCLVCVSDRVMMARPSWITGESTKVRAADHLKREITMEAEEIIAKFVAD